MTRTMYDSTTTADVPADADMVAGYADGAFANLDALRKRFPHATVVSIAVTPGTRAHVLDVERGDASPAGAVRWCTDTMADTSNRELTVYCAKSAWPAVRHAFDAAGVTQPQYWIADWDGSASIPSGAVAKQYRNASGYDVSSVRESWPGVD